MLLTKPTIRQSSRSLASSPVWHSSTDLPGRLPRDRAVVEIRERIGAASARWIDSEEERDDEDDQPDATSADGKAAAAATDAAPVADLDGSSLAPRRNRIAWFCLQDGPEQTPEPEAHMMTESFDLIVIGAGSAARQGAAKAAKGHGARVAMIERERWGGSCPNVACRPTKAYLVAAELAHDVNTLAAKLGIDVGPAGVDLGRVKARKDSLLTPQERWRERLTEAGYELVEGTASFEDAHTVRVGERRLSAERILVATGSRTALPPIAGLDEVGWLDHVSALDTTELPASLLVVGGGPVGLEFAQAFSRYGSKVTIVDAVERIAFRDDRDAAAELAAALHDDGIEIVTSTFVKDVRHDSDAIVATLSPRDGGGERDLRVAQILLASGRVPNVEEPPSSGPASSKARPGSP